MKDGEYYVLNVRFLKDDPELVELRRRKEAGKRLTLSGIIRRAMRLYFDTVKEEPEEA